MIRLHHHHHPHSKRKRNLSVAALTLLFVTIAAWLPSCTASNPFSSNVVALTARNWRQEVEESPHAVFVNICRQGCGYCQLLTPEWEKLAGAVKGNVKIAYWDTEQRGAPPPLLGEIKGTPTIRMFNPKKKQGNSNKKKVVLDYNYERKAKDMKQFVEGNMPSFIEMISTGKSGLSTFAAKAERNGLPQALLFTSKAKTLAMTKYLSTEFRRKLLIGEIHPTKPNKEIMDLYGVTDLPALIIIPPPTSEDASPIRYEGDKFTKHKLESFLSQHALKDPVFPSKKKKEEEVVVDDTDKKPEPVKTEL